MKAWKNKGNFSSIGVDLGECAVKAAQVRTGGGDDRPRLVAAALLERCRPGEPFDAEEAARLRQVLQRRGFRGRRIVLGLPGRRAMTSVMTLPPRKEGVPLDQIVRSELAHEHRCGEEPFEVGWWELPRPARAPAGTHVMAVGATHPVADAMIEVLQGAGFEVTALDTEGWAMARACRPLVRDGTGITAIADLGWDSTTLVLLHQEVVIYERCSFGTAMRQLRRTLAQEMGFAPPVIDYVLHDVGFRPDERGQDDDWRLMAKSLAHLQAHYDHAVKELGMALDYAQSQYPGAEIQRLLLVGGGAMVPGADVYIGSQLETRAMAVRPADLADGCESLGEIAALASLVPAIGLARHGESADWAKEAA